MSERKRKFMEKLEKAMEKGWRPKDPTFIPKVELLPGDVFEEALDISLNKEEPTKEEKAE